MTLARWISILLHPFVTAAVMVAAAAPRQAGRSVLTVALFTIVPMAILMALQVRRGKWENVDASNKRERPILFVVGIAGAIALLAYLVVSGSQWFMIRGAAFALAMILVCAAATRWIKVSLHLAFASFAASGLLLIGSPIGWGMAAAVPVLAWSRWKLKRHTPLELILGCAIGVATGLALRFI